MTMREADIRPQDLMSDQAERYQADVDRLLEKRAEFVEVPCPACDGDERREAFHKYTLAYQVCERCDTLYLSPRPTPPLLEEYYRTSENYSYWNEVIFPASEPQRREKIFRPRVDTIMEICGRYGLDGGRALDIGAGFGTFCEELAARDIFDEIIALEPTPALAKTCRERGFTVLESPIEEIDANSDRFNLVASFEVIEHLYAPHAFVLSCARLLAPGGLLVLTCPNWHGFDIAMLRELSSAVDTEHLNYFHPGSLLRLLQRCSLEVIEISTPGRLDAELVRKEVLAGRVNLSGQPFLATVLLDRWEELGTPFQEFLVRNRLSSHMWAVARRVQ